MSAHTPRTVEQVLDLPDATVLQLLADRLSPTVGDTVHGLHHRPAAVTEAASARVRYLLLLLAFDTSPFACPHCSADLAADLDAALRCATEHGALAARAQNQADRAARRLTDLVTTGTTNRWD
ncbi:hypothetical protein [Blastococcus sp. SYSU DS0539]